jgi:uncharacterized protein (DUF302 family)
LFYERVSQRSPQEIRLAAEECVRRRGLVLLGVYELQEMYLKAGVTLRADLAIFEVADPRSDREILSRVPQATAVMPFRFAVYVREGRPRVAAVLPRLYLRLLPIPRASRRELSAVVAKFEARLKATIRDLCRRPVSARRI